MSITKNTMVVNLQIGVWMGYRLDKEASQELTDHKGADADAARVNTHLVPKEALKPIVTAASAVRNHFYAKTLPWKDNGDRLLVRLLYMPFMVEHDRLVGEFRNARDHFLDTAYLAAQDQAAFRMGALFKPDVYPSVESLRRRFYVALDVDAVTEAGDFRVEMEQTMLDVLQQGMETTMQNRIGRAMQDVWSRLGATLGHFAEKMGSDGVFRDTTVRNLEELVDILPALNIMNDPALERIRQDIKDTIVGFEAKDLRKDNRVRTIAATEAKRIMEDMSGFMNAFGAGK